ncbi:mRNA splicing protein MSL5, partial [Ascoidea rubescens DSM 1968]
MPTEILYALTPEQLEAYQILFRIEEISQKLRKTNEFLKPPPTREVSPPPKYDASGKRINTREYRYRKRLENERYFLVDIAINSIPGFKPPIDFKKKSKIIKKLFIPKNHYDINFIGLLLGPRGNTLKKNEELSGARIAIRGKGSVKEGKNRSTINEKQNNLDEDLHVLITGDNNDTVDKAISLCQNIINKAISTPEGQNDFKKGQLRELAALNGTLREPENRPCAMCGETGHKRYECPNSKNFVNSIFCSICKRKGHLERDCK